MYSSHVLYLGFTPQTLQTKTNSQQRETKLFDLMHPLALYIQSNELYVTGARGTELPPPF
jgi:hypothetical protein